MKSKQLLSLLPIALLLASCGGEGNKDASTSFSDDDSRLDSSIKESSGSENEQVSSSLSENQSISNQVDSFVKEDTPDIESDLSSQEKETVNEGEVIDVSSLEEGATKKITEAGTYVLKGENSNARIQFNTSGDVKLILLDVNLSSEEDAPIEVKGASSFLIYLPSGTKNIISDSENNTLDGAIVVKKTALTISGEGYLYVSGRGLSTDTIDSGVAIQAAKGVVIQDAHIIVPESNSHAINGKAGVTIENAKISIKSLADGIHSKEGAVFLSSSVFVSDTYGDGIDATASLDIKNATTHIVTHGTFVLYDASNDTDGSLYEDSKYIKNGDGYKKISSDDMSHYTTRYYLKEKCKGVKSDGALSIDGGDYYFYTDDDAIASDLSIDITSGDFVIYTLDQGINSDQLINIGSPDCESRDTNFAIRIFHSFEGIQGGEIHFYNGYTYIQSDDDGINATSDTLTSISMNFHRNSIVNVNASGDGIDSNGSITMDGGDLYVFGPTNGGDSSLDFDGSFTFSGGNLLAFSEQGMVEVPTSSGANIVSLNLGSYSANQVFTIVGVGYEFSAILPKSYSSLNVIAGGPYLLTGGSYNVFTNEVCSASFVNNVYVGSAITTSGTSVTSFTVQEGVTTVGGSSQPGGGPGNGHGGGGAGPRH